MIDYQKYLLDIIESEAHEAWRRSKSQRPPHPEDITVSYVDGQIIASHRNLQSKNQTIRTIAVLHVRFWGSKTMSASLNDSIQPGQPLVGPNAPGIYHWIPGESTDETQLNRMLTEWATAIEEYQT